MLRREIVSIGVLPVLAYISTSAFGGGGPLSDYYLTAGDSSTNILANGSTFDIFQQRHEFEYPIAVTGTVRTSGTTRGKRGAEYDGGFNYLGVDFPLDAPGQAEFFDGTTDGQFFYAIEYFSGDLYRFDKDWSNRELMFSVGDSGEYLAVTYDPSNDSFWVARWDGTKVENYDRDGDLLSRFGVGHDGITCLAMEFDRGILWTGDTEDPGRFRGFNRQGNLVETVNYGFNHDTLGGEFDRGAVARVTGFEVRKGQLVSGSQVDLRNSDGDRLQVDAEPAAGNSQVMELEVKLKSTVNNPGNFDLTVEHKIDQAGGTAKISIKNWQTGNFDQIDSGGIGSSEQTNTVDNLDGPTYIKGNGLILVRIKHTVADPTGTVRSEIDLVQAAVRK